MELKIRHLSGSRAGEEQRFPGPSVRLGRESSNEVRFDAHRDLLVSARHAEIRLEGDRWVIKDLGSANGTWIDGQRITLRELHDGERIEFGQGGPSIEVRLPEERPVAATISGAAVPTPAGTTVMSVQDLLTGRRDRVPEPAAKPAPPVEGGTTVMSMDQIVPPTDRLAGFTPLPPQPAPKPGRSRIWIALAAVLATMVLGMALIVVRTVNVRRNAQKVARKAAASQPAASQAPAETATAAQETAAVATSPVSDTTGTGAATSDNLRMEELERQYRESRALADRLQQELAAKEEAAAAQPKVIVKYVPKYITVPAGKAPESSEKTPAGTADPQAAAAKQSAAPAPAAKTEEPPQTAARSRQAEPPAAHTTRAPASEAKKAAAPAKETAAEPEPAMNIAATKRLKRRIGVVSTPADFPVPSMPGSFPMTVAQAFAGALASTGTILVDKGGPTAVQVSVTNYTVAQKKLDTAKAGSVARGIGALAGVRTPKTPASASSASWDVSLSARLRLVNAKGREIDTKRASAEVKESKSTARLDRVGSVGDSSSADTPLHDAMRQLVASALDDVLGALPGSDPTGTVKSFRSGVATLDFGRTVGLEPDDVLEVMDAKGNGIAQLRVDTVSETSSTAKLVTGSTDVSGKGVRYLGSPFDGPKAPAISEPVRTVTVTRATEGRKGPGMSFEKAATAVKGASYRQVYLVGNWVKVSGSRGESYWLPADSVIFE